MYSALDWVDWKYQLLMRGGYIPRTAVSMPSGILWDWLIILERLSNASATLNYLVTQLFRPQPSLWTDLFYWHFLSKFGRKKWSDMKNHIDHLQAFIECTCTYKLYPNASMCIFTSKKYFRVLLVESEAFEYIPLRFVVLVNTTNPEGLAQIAWPCHSPA